MPARPALTGEAPWRAFHLRWPMIRPPQRPTAEVATAARGAIAGHDARVLLLGVTPELSTAGDDLTAVDWSEMMIGCVWPGDREDRRAVLSDWRSLPASGSPFSAVIGVGSFNCLEYPQGYHDVFASLGGLLAPGSRFAVRFFVTPDPCESVASLRADVVAGAHAMSIHGLKWRLAMALCAASARPNIPVQEILARFDEEFLDRAALERATGWGQDEIGTMDNYRGSSDVCSFPTESQILATLPPSFRNARFIPSGSYELSERCPILTMDYLP